jgi:DNA repair protein RadC
MAMVRLAELPVDQRPVRRLLRLGVHALTDAELVAVLLATGQRQEGALDVAHRLLSTIGGVSGLRRWHPEQLVGLPGIGPTKAARLVAALALPTRGGRTEGVVAYQPADLAPVVQPILAGLRHERFAVVVCDRRSRVRAVRTITDGVSDCAPLMMRDTLATVFRHDGHAFAVAHNHPSGDPTPSAPDRQATMRFRAAAETAGLTFLCHLVLGDDTWRLA